MNERTTAYHLHTINRLAESAKKVGLKLVKSKMRYPNLALVPLDEELPIYTRDAELFTGSAEYLEAVIDGWNFAFGYYSSLGLLSDKKVETKEEQWKQKRTLTKLSTGIDILSDK